MGAPKCGGPGPRPTRPTLKSVPDADEFKVTESQTDESETIEFGINIDEVKVENIEDVLNEDSNGTIHTSHDKV